MLNVCANYFIACVGVLYTNIYVRVCVYVCVCVCVGCLSVYNQVDMYVPANMCVCLSMMMLP